jgi:hypothetical protein
VVTQEPRVCSRLHASVSMCWWLNFAGALLATEMWYVISSVFPLLVIKIDLLSWSKLGHVIWALHIFTPESRITLSAFPGVVQQGPGFETWGNEHLSHWSYWDEPRGQHS